MRTFSGERLEQLRGRTTQTDLASALRRQGFGTTQTTISRWESGQKPNAAVLPVLAAELGVKVDELFTEADEDDRLSPLASASTHDILEALAPLVRLLEKAASR